MGRQCSVNRSTSNLRILLLLALAWQPLQLSANEFETRSFSAQYRLYKGGVHVADSELSLQKSGEFWRWRMSSSASGVYSLFSDSNPYSETTFILSNGVNHIHNILIADTSDKKKYETARFDWEQGIVKVLRKKKQQDLRLETEVFDYHSIHLLAASMVRQNLKSRQVDFYRKGKLVKSLLKFEGRGEFELNGETRQVNKFQQTISGSKTRLSYFYDAGNPMLPLRVERKRKGSKNTVMLLEQVHWES